MDYVSHYDSPLGGITLAGDGQALTGLWFDGQKYFAAALPGEREERDLPLFQAAARWLDRYFQGEDPGPPPPLAFPSATPFRRAVWELLGKIPYGQTVTYGALGARLAAARGLASLSAQAVGGAVGHNPISLMVPCHRVVGAGGSLTGYAGGVEKKRALLALEGVDLSRLSVPSKGTAL